MIIYYIKNVMVTKFSQLFFTHCVLIEKCIKCFFQPSRNALIIPPDVNSLHTQACFFDDSRAVELTNDFHAGIASYFQFNIPVLVIITILRYPFLSIYV